MSLFIADNFAYSGKKPNFARDSYDTLADLKAVRDVDIDDGHLAFCAEDRKTYKFDSSNSVDSVTGKWRIFAGNTVTEVSALTRDYTVRNNPSTTSEDIYYIKIGSTPHNILGDTDIRWNNGQLPQVEANSTVFVSVMNNLAVWGIFK